MRSDEPQNILEKLFDSELKEVHFVKCRSVTGEGGGERKRHLSLVYLKQQNEKCRQKREIGMEF